VFCFERRLFKRIEGVKIGELKELLGAYIMPLFGDENSNCLVVCHPAKSETRSNFLLAQMLCCKLSPSWRLSVQGGASYP